MNIKRYAPLFALWLAACFDSGPVPRLTSTSPDPEDSDCIDDDAFWTKSVQPLVNTECIACHSPTGAAKDSRYVLDGDNDRGMLEELIHEEPELLLDKPTARVQHGGSQRFDAYDPRYATLHEFVARTLEPGACEHPGEPPLTCTNETVEPGPTPLLRLTDDQIRHSLFDLLGISLAEGVIPITTTGTGFRTWLVNNTVSGASVETFMLAAEQISQQIYLNDVACPADDVPCARTALLDLASRAWRRSLSEEEQAILTRFLDAGVPAERGLRMGVEMMIQAPQFLYQSLRTADAVVGTTHDKRPVRWLDGASLAARLSYFLTNAPPDATLQMAAEAGELNSRQAVAEQAQRLVLQPTVTRAVAAFHRDWLDMTRFDGAERDAIKYPNYSDATRAAIYQELDLYTTEVIWNGAATFEALFSSNRTWVNSELAALYGLPDPGPGWHPVTLDASRPGLLTRLGFLAGHANASSSNPVRRGAFVLQELLCEHLEPPADVNMDLPEPTSEATTIRERLEQHWTNPACAACHVRIDPLGFAFENFGALGEWRDNWDNDIAIDATGELGGASFDGAAEAVAVVRNLKRARACYATRWFEYAVGRAVTDNDACSLRQLHDRFESGDGDLRSLLVDVTLTDAFLMRQEASP